MVHGFIEGDADLAGIERNFCFGVGFLDNRAFFATAPFCFDINVAEVGNKRLAAITPIDAGHPYSQSPEKSMGLPIFSLKMNSQPSDRRSRSS